MRPSAGSIFLPLSLTASLLASCASTGLAPKPMDVNTAKEVVMRPDWAEPAPLNVAQAALPNNDWIASFSDSQLTQLVAEALSRNNDISAAAARLDAALARERIAGAAGKPTLSGSGRLSRTEDAGSSFGDRTGISAGLNASWEPDLWGRIRNSVDASELDTQASAADLAGANLSIAGQVTQTWLNLIEARLLTELSERDIETQERALRLTERRFEGGVTGSSDVRLARSNLASSQALQALREQSKSATARQLEVLLARYPAEEIEAARELPELPPLSNIGLPGDVLARRPDLLAADARMHSQGLQVDIARKALLPSLTLSGDSTASGNSLRNFFDIDALVANLIGNLSAPIFQGGRLQGNVEQQEALLRSQIESYAGSVLQAYLEVENALDAETRLAEREAALRVSLEESRKAEERLELRYTEGLATILQLLDAQARRLSAEGQLISARKERLANRVRLHVALGGGQYGAVPPIPEAAPYRGILSGIL